jgi:hypothetical protein
MTRNKCKVLFPKLLNITKMNFSIYLVQKAIEFDVEMNLQKKRKKEKISLVFPSRPSPPPSPMLPPPSS